MKKRWNFCFLVLVLFLAFPLTVNLHAEEPAGLSDGQTIYVPAYSHIYSGSRERPFLLTVTLSIRNIDPDNPISLIVADYYETQGRLLNKYVDQPVTLSPLESTRFVVPEKSSAGGSGANFIVEWKASKAVNPPIVESVMIGTQGQQGVSFTSRGKEIFPTE